MTDPDTVHDLFYQRLGVGSDASRDEIVHAYRRLAHGAHPDAHPGDPDAARRFREITEAYEVLADPSRRASYDRTRAARPIRMIIRPSEGRPPASSWTPRDVVAADPIVFLGATRRAMGDVPFRAGPVRVEPPSQEAPSGGGFQQDALMRLFARTFDAWGQQ